MLKWSKSWERWYRRALPAYWVFLFCATHFPRPKIPGSVPPPDWVLHSCAFAALTFLFWRFAESFSRPLSNRFVWFAFVVLGVYSAIDEYLQQFVNRTTSIWDGLANLAGIAVVLTLLELYRRRSTAARQAARDRAEGECSTTRP